MLQKVSFCGLKLVLLRIHLQIERWERPSGGHANWSRLESMAELDEISGVQGCF